MAIDGLKENLIKTLPGAIKNNSFDNKVSSKQTTSTSATSSNNDQVQITDNAKVLAQATDVAKNASGIDSNKVKELKQAIENGTYKVNYDSVASKIIDSEDEINLIFK